LMTRCLAMAEALVRILHLGGLGIAARPWPLRRRPVYIPHPMLARKDT
jgi:hypothetical protein